MSGQPEYGSPLIRPFVVRDSSLADTRFGQLKGSIVEHVTQEGGRVRHRQGFLEPFNWYSQAGPLFPGTNIAQRVTSVALSADHENPMGPALQDQDALNPWRDGLGWGFGQRGTRVADMFGRTAHVPQGWKVWDGLTLDYTTAIPMGPVIGPGGGLDNCSLIPPPSEGYNFGGLAGDRRRQQRSTTGGTNAPDPCGYPARFQTVAQGAQGAGAGYMWDGTRGGLLSTLLVIHEDDMYGAGIDGGPSGILSIRCDAHFDYTDWHGPIDFRGTHDATRYPYPKRGQPYKVYMARDRTDPERGSAIGLGNCQWVPWYVEATAQTERSTQQTYPPPNSGRTSPPPPPPPPDPEPKDYILENPFPPSAAGGGAANDGLLELQGGALLYVTQPTYDRALETERMDGLLYYQGGVLDSATGRMETQVAQFDGGVVAMGFTLPGSNSQVGASSSGDPELRWGSTGTDYYAVIKLDNTNEEVCLATKDNTDSIDVSNLPWTFKSDAVFQQGATFTGAYSVQIAEGRSQWYAAVEADNGATTTIATLPVGTDTTVVIRAAVSVVRTDGGSEASEGAWYDVAGGFRNDAGTVTQIGSTSTTPNGEDDAALDVALTISGTDVLLTFTGVGGKTFYGGAHVTTSVAAVPS